MKRLPSPGKKVALGLRAHFRGDVSLDDGVDRFSSCTGSVEFAAHVERSSTARLDKECLANLQACNFQRNQLVSGEAFALTHWGYSASSNDGKTSLIDDHLDQIAIKDDRVCQIIAVVKTVQQGLNVRHFDIDLI